jgi:hypothetical protein
MVTCYDQHWRHLQASILHKINYTFIRNFYVNRLRLIGIIFQVRNSRGADKSLARPTSRCILFDGENISFDASLVIYK